MSALSDRLDEIRHVEVKLGNVEPHFPDLRIWACASDDDSPAVVLALDALHGQQKRFAEMSPDDARLLAHRLIEMANEADAVTVCEVEP